MLEVSPHGKVLKLKIGNSIIDGKKFMNQRYTYSKISVFIHYH